MPNFKQYYKALSWKKKSSLNRQIYEKTNIPYSTLYRKIENENFRKLEKEAIAKIIGLSIEELFPNN